MSAAQLSSSLWLEEPSVYRNLELLERQGMIRHLHLGRSAGLYALACEDDEPEYLYCEHCGKSTAVAPAEIEPIRDQTRQRFGYSARVSG